MNTHKFQIGLLTVVVLVGLRLALGCHFLYEGVWKIEPTNEFKAEPFLTQAKGPVAQLFYAMVPDINGRERLRVDTGADGKKSINTDALDARWDQIRLDFINFYGASAPAVGAGKNKTLDQASKEVSDRFKKLAQEYFNGAGKGDPGQVDDIVAYFGALDRFQGTAPHAQHTEELKQDAPFQQERQWKRMMELRGEVNNWIKDVDAQEKAYKDTLYTLLDEQQKAKGTVPRTWNIFFWERSDQINFAVTYGLTAIGLCLMLGLCSRLAALGGAAFMCFVVMTQPAIPGLYPPDPAVVGHAMLLNKDFIEMMALLVIASVPAGRWGGLDYFLYHIFRSFASRWLRKDARA